MSHLVDQSQAGVFDPYSDDPRLAVKKLAMCPVTGLLAAAGTAGQIVIAELSDSDVEKEISVSARWSSFRFFVNVCVCVCVCVCVFLIFLDRSIWERIRLPYLLNANQSASPDVSFNRRLQRRTIEPQWKDNFYGTSP